MWLTRASNEDGAIQLIPLSALPSVLVLADVCKVVQKGAAINKLHFGGGPAETTPKPSSPRRFSRMHDLVQDDSAYL